MVTGEMLPAIDQNGYLYLNIVPLQDRKQDFFLINVVSLFP